MLPPNPDRIGPIPLPGGEIATQAGARKLSQDGVDNGLFISELNRGAHDDVHPSEPLFVLLFDQLVVERRAAELRRQL